MIRPFAERGPIASPRRHLRPVRPSEPLGCHRLHVPFVEVGAAEVQAVSFRHENLRDEKQALQRDLDRSWERSQETLADPVKRAYLEESIERVNASTSSTTVTKDEFLARSEPPTA